MRSEFKQESLAKRWIKHPNGNLAEQVAYMETFPTPTVGDTRTVGLTNRKDFPQVHLSEYIALYPTPQATSWGCSGARKKLRELQAAGKITEHERKRMQAGNGGKLNPTWVEWLMAFPLGWTDLDV